MQIHVDLTTVRSAWICVRSGILSGGLMRMRLGLTDRFGTKAPVHLDEHRRRHQASAPWPDKTSLGKDLARRPGGSRHQRITPDTPRHNRKVEHYNRILSEEFLYARTWTAEDESFSVTASNGARRRSGLRGCLMA
jgi:hypothetical protein